MTFSRDAWTVRTTATLCVVALLSGCCALPPRMPATAALASSWANLQGLGTASVRVLLDDGRIVKGHAERVTDTGLWVALKEGGSQFLARDAIVRVVQLSSESAPRAKSGALVGLGMAALVSLGSTGVFWFALAFEPPVFAGLGALSGLPLRHEIVVFDRQ